jgi:serine/threonine protein kinase
MPLTPGARLGPYQVLAPAGAGGMGEVYRATDTRLNRTVALKILPRHLSENAEMRERFEREAQTIAGLNHPHICTLHDVGHHEGVDFLVMEYVQGETLAARLERGPLPIAEALRIAAQAGTALDAAHRQGVVHRDVKPGNVMLTKGSCKLLDFGLAKLRSSGPAMPVTVTAAPTGMKDLTMVGSVMGTLQYMAPEQIEGKDADARTDIFAFGAMLYEMLTGQKAFQGKSQVSLIAAILEHEPPPMTALQPGCGARGVSHHAV